MNGKTIIALFAMLLAGATSSRAVTLPDACGSDQVKFNVKTQRNHSAVPEPGAGQALIVFVEKMNREGMGFCLGCNVTTRVGVDGAWAGANKGDSYFTFSVTPGKHHVCVNWQSDLHGLASKSEALAFTAEAGKVYYFETDVLMKSQDAGQHQSYIEDRLHVKQVEADEGQYLAKASALSEWKTKK
jgi:hypothetical protein